MRSSGPHSAGHLQVQILAKVTVSLLWLGSETERDTPSRAPRRMANFVDNRQLSSSGGSSIVPSVSSSYAIDMSALTGKSREGSEIEIHVSDSRSSGAEAGGNRTVADLAVERMSADDVFPCRISIVTYCQRNPGWHLLIISVERSLVTHANGYEISRRKDSEFPSPSQGIDGLI